MGMFTSLLCCGVDAKDDSDDRYHRPPTRTAAAPPQAKSSQYGSTSVPAAPDDKSDAPKAPKKSKKDLMDEDHLVNETDTITNTNEDSNAAPALHTAAVPEEKPQDSAAPADDAPAANGDDTPDKDAESVFDLTKIQEGQAFNPDTGFLLPAKDTARFGNKKCLILDLDETLVHSSFKYLRTADFVIPVEIDNQVHHVYVIKRPGVDEFLRKVGKWYEVVVFTASVAKYGDPLLNKLDIHHVVHHRLFRDLCYSYQGNFIKNLSQIGRPLADLIIIDNSPASYIFHPQHSIPISSWFSDTHDNELLDLLPLLEDLSKMNVDDVSLTLDITI